MLTTAAGETTAFDPAEAVVEATGPIAITFRNASSLPHNLTFTAGLTAATRTIVSPGTSDELVVSPLAPGTYPFVCTIHDGMAGTLIVRSTGAISDPATVR
jgi:plastocyanin